MIVQDYLNLITSQYANQPNFTAMISADVAPAVQVQTLLTSMLPLFDLNTPPVGNQLDIIGQWAGISRNISTPISGTGIWFSWDDMVYGDGWDLGSWQPTSNPSQIVVLPDDAYLTLIQAKIAANQWDGTTEGAYAIWGIFFPEVNLLIQDHGNMSYDIIILGTEISALKLAILTGGYIQLKPEGVQIGGYYTAVTPVFGWDVSNATFGGWDVGNWAVKIAPGS